MLIKKLFPFILICFGALLFGEEIIVESIDVSVKGITNRNSILRVAELEEGQIFNSVADLENALKLAQDKLDDVRVFKSVNVDYEMLDMTGDVRPVVVTLNIEDSWNIIALPYPKYDSNSGFTFKLAARDYNFMGLMEPLRVDFVYEYDENQQHNFAANMTYTLNFPIAGQSFSLGLSQDFNFKPSDSDDVFYMSTGASLGTSFQLPWDIYDGNHINYSLSTSIDRDYIPLGIISDARDELNLGFSHGFSLGRSSWDGNNYRDGLTSSISNGWSLPIDSNDNADLKEALSSTLSGNIAFHKDMYPLGYSGRVGFNQYLLNDDTGDIQGPFRGILSSNGLNASGYVYMNNALYITVWNNDKIWEIMGGPCLDLGYRWGIPSGDELQEPIIWSLAVDGLCYPAFAKSFQARITIGLSGNGFMASEGDTLTRVKGNLEMFFGLGKFF